MIDLSMLPQGAITAILQVIMIDLVLAGDNAVVIGLAAAGLPPPQRSKAILVGIIAATALRLAFAAIAVEVLEDVAGPARPRPGRNRGRAHEGGGACSAKDLCAGRLADRGCRCVDVTRQRARSGGRGAGPSLCVDIRAWPVDCPDGCCRDLYRPVIEQAPMDRLCGSRDHSLCLARNDLAWILGNRTACFRLEPVARKRGGERGRGRTSGRENDT